MINNNYEIILEKISRISGVEKSEIQRRVDAKRAKLSDLISKEGAAQIVAAELGISFDNEKLKISELLPGMKKVNVSGKVITLFPVREFNKNGKSGKVVNFIIADDTSNIKVVLWDTNHISLIETKQVAIGSVVEIGNGTMRENEVHLGSFSELKISNEKFENVKTELASFEKQIVDFKIADNIRTRAFVVQIFEPKFFEVCPECKKRAIPEGANSFICEEHGTIIPEKRVLINFVIDDGSETIRAILFNDLVQKLGVTVTDLQSSDVFTSKREELLGKEMIFHGNVRKNKMFETPEFIVSDLKDLDLESVITELEK